MNIEKYGVLVVGAGWVSTQHIAAYLNTPHATVVAVCDRQIDNRPRKSG
jgi:predicted dehydrogenase